MIIKNVMLYFLAQKSMLIMVLYYVYYIFSIFDQNSSSVLGIYWYIFFFIFLVCHKKKFNSFICVATILIKQDEELLLKCVYFMKSVNNSNTTRQPNPTQPEIYNFLFNLSVEIFNYQCKFNIEMTRLL